jgi:long-chain acyl-CoA synthetase
LQLALDDGSRRVRYGELAWLVDEDRRWLAACGGRRFALLADNGVGWAIADLALHLAGLLSVPLPGYFTPAQTLHALEDAGIDALLTDTPERMRDLL